MRCGIFVERKNLAMCFLAPLFITKERRLAHPHAPLVSAHDVVELLDFYLRHPNHHRKRCHCPNCPTPPQTTAVHRLSVRLAAWPERGGRFVPRHCSRRTNACRRHLGAPQATMPGREAERKHFADWPPFREPRCACAKTAPSDPPWSRPEASTVFNLWA